MTGKVGCGRVGAERWGAGGWASGAGFGRNPVMVVGTGLVYQ